MDISKTTEPRSDQLNFDDVTGHHLDVTIVEVRRGSAEQPVELHLAGYPGRPYKPGKSMRRVIVNAWGSDADVYVGRRMRLYGDPTIKFGKDTVGGIRIAALSHLDGPKSMPLTVTRGKRAMFTVQPLEEPRVDATPHLEALAAATTLDELQAVWKAAAAAGVTNIAEVVALKDERKAKLAEVVEEGQ